MDFSLAITFATTFIIFLYFIYMLFGFFSNKKGKTPPHESMEDCTVGGYIIPKGTRVLFNYWKIQRDPTIWSEPDVFKPERFLTTHKDIDFRGNHFELIPFGVGRRICPGISSTLVLLHLTLANILHAFEITRPSDEPIDMTANFGTKVTPLEVLVAPRLSQDLYY